MLLSLSIGSAFLLKAARLPDPLVWFVAALMIAGAVFANLMPVRLAGTVVGIVGLTLVFHAAPEPSPALAYLLVLLATLQFAATVLLISADLSIAKEKPSLEL